MSQNITLMGASYTGVPACKLPKTGGGMAQFDDTTDADATAGDILKNKTAYVNGSKLTGTYSPVIVQGEFTTGATRNSTGTVTIPYTGTGYPIALMVFVKNGAYNNGTGGDTTWYDSVNQYDCGVYYMSKSRVNFTPTWATSNVVNGGVTAIIYKNSTSSSTTYTRASNMAANTFTSSSTDASAGNLCVVFKGNAKTLSYYIGNKGSNKIGLAPSTTFQYIAVYSS